MLASEMCHVQIVMVPIVKKEADRDAVMAAIERLHAAAVAAGLRCKLDASTDKTPGWKFNHYEMKVSHALKTSLVCHDYKAACMFQKHRTF